MTTEQQPKTPYDDDLVYLMGEIPQPQIRTQTVRDLVDARAGYLRALRDLGIPDPQAYRQAVDDVFESALDVVHHVKYPSARMRALHNALAALSAAREGQS